MHREGHVGIGLLLFSPIAYVLMEFGMAEVLALSMAAMAFWSFAPDIDMGLPIRHRGPTHTLLAAGIAGTITAAIAVYFASKGTGASASFVIRPPILAIVAAALFGFFIGALGVISHLIGDVLTPMGIRPLWPHSDRQYSLGLVVAANKRANQVCSSIGIGAFVGAIVLAELI